MIEERKLANEGRAMFYVADSMRWQDRCQFVANLGWLLRQTRESIASVKLERQGKGYETAVVRYNDGFTEKVNVSHDSYLAIMKDVVKDLQKESAHRSRAVDGRNRTTKTTSEV